VQQYLSLEQLRPQCWALQFSAILAQLEDGFVKEPKHVAVGCIKNSLYPIDVLAGCLFNNVW
jgi:hypothetical protein